MVLDQACAGGVGEIPRRLGEHDLRGAGHGRPVGVVVRRDAEVHTFERRERGRVARPQDRQHDDVRARADGLLDGEARPELVVPDDVEQVDQLLAMQHRPR